MGGLRQIEGTRKENQERGGLRLERARTSVGREEELGFEGARERPRREVRGLLRGLDCKILVSSK